MDTLLTTAEVTRRLGLSLSTPAIWGGDWNHPLTGSDAGYYGGRAATLAALAGLDMIVPTAELPSRSSSGSIDHIAVPASAEVKAALHVEVVPRLSDHDLYVVEISLEIATSHASPTQFPIDGERHLPPRTWTGERTKA